MTAKATSFAIAHHLLDEQMSAPAWTNLGCWRRLDGTPITHYREAAEQLATRLGMLAITVPAQCVVDLGCGFGASLRLWSERFFCTQVIGMELQAACLDSWQIRPGDGITLHQGRFDQLPLPEPIRTQLSATGCDAVLCVDAAYHAESLRAFVAVAQKLLGSQGRLAFSTVLKPDRLSVISRWQHRLIARLTGIPSASFVSAKELEHTLTQLGFEAIRIDVLDEAVLQGFSRFVARRRKALTSSQKRTVAWLKIASTAALCQHWFRCQQAHYVLVSAQRSN